MPPVGRRSWMLAVARPSWSRHMTRSPDRRSARLPIKRSTKQHGSSGVSGPLLIWTAGTCAYFALAAPETGPRGARHSLEPVHRTTSAVLTAIAIGGLVFIVA